MLETFTVLNSLKIRETRKIEKKKKKKKQTQWKAIDQKSILFTDVMKYQHPIYHNYTMGFLLHFLQILQCLTISL